MIISLVELAAITLHIEAGITLDRSRQMVAQQSVFYSLIRDPHSRAVLTALARNQQEIAA